MYVCVCNAINCRTVRRAAADGACSVSAVFKVAGKTPQCGRCFETMRDMIAEEAGNRRPNPVMMAAE